MALAHWFNITFNDNTSNKKLFFKLKFLHVDNTFLKEKYSKFNTEQQQPLIDERNMKKEVFKKLFDTYKFQYEIINLENVLNLNPLNNIELPFDNYGENLNLKENNFDLITKYLKIYEHISKAGSFEADFNKILTNNLIFFYSRINGFNKIIFANNGQSLVENLFNSIIKGRGFTAKEGISYVDSRYFNGNPVILRPLKDFLDKEILLFNHMHKVELFHGDAEIDLLRYNLKMNTPFKGNTNNLLGSFFDNLQNRMSATITTVLGTADKLKEQKDVYKTNILNFKICEFCLSYVDNVYNILEIGSLDSIKNE